jgi:hypothetical protein
MTSADGEAHLPQESGCRHHGQRQVTEKKVTREELKRIALMPDPMQILAGLGGRNL